MDYKTLYVELAYLLTSLGCYVCDFDFLGHVTLSKGIKAFIYINPKMSYKHKFFVLTHEAGHIFYMKKGNKFNWSKKTRNEKQANFFAIQILRLAGGNKEEYYQHYNKACQRNVKRKKSWFQL